MKRRSKLTIIFSIVAVLVVLRAVAPVAIEFHLNENLLADLGEYRGHVGDVDLALWRAAVRLEELHLEKTTGNVWVEFLKVPAIDASISPTALLNRTVRVDVTIDQPEINFVDADNAEDQQMGTGLALPVDPDPDPDPMFETEVDSLEVRGGTIAFRNFTSNPEVNLQVNDIDLTSNNLSVAPDGEGERIGRLDITGELPGESPFSVEAEFDPADYESFVAASELTLNDLTQINSFARAYGNLDFKGGGGELIMELRAQDGALSGYAKPAFEDVDIFDWEQDVEERDKNPVRLMWEGLSGNLSAIFSNPRTETMTTRIDIQGEIPETSADAWGAIFGIVRNAFIDALNTNFEHITPLEVDAEEDEDTG